MSITVRPIPRVRSWTCHSAPQTGMSAANSADRSELITAMWRGSRLARSRPTIGPTAMLGTSLMARVSPAASVVP